MDSSRPCGGPRDTNTLPCGDEENQLGVPEQNTPQAIPAENLHLAVSQNPSLLLRMARFIFCTSTLLTAAVSAVLWHIQLFRCLFRRSPTVPDIFIFIGPLKFAPAVFLCAVTLELAAYTWWRLRRRRLDSQFSFPVYFALHVFVFAFDGAMDYLFLHRWIIRWLIRRGYGHMF